MDRNVRQKNSIGRPQLAHVITVKVGRPNVCAVKNQAKRSRTHRICSEYYARGSLHLGDGTGNEIGGPDVGAVKDQALGIGNRISGQDAPSGVYFHHRAAGVVGDPNTGSVKDHGHRRGTNSEITQILSAPEMRDTLAGQGLDAVTSTPEQFGALMKSDLSRWAQVVKSAGIRAE